MRRPRYPLHTRCFGAAVQGVLQLWGHERKQLEGLCPLCCHNLDMYFFHQFAFMFHMVNLFTIWHISAHWKTVKNHVLLHYNNFFSAFLATKTDNGFLECPFITSLLCSHIFHHWVFFSYSSWPNAWKFKKHEVYLILLRSFKYFLKLPANQAIIIIISFSVIIKYCRKAPFLNTFMI